MLCIFGISSGTAYQTSTTSLKYRIEVITSFVEHVVLGNASIQSHEVACGIQTDNGNVKQYGYHDQEN